MTSTALGMTSTLELEDDCGAPRYVLICRGEARRRGVQCPRAPRPAAGGMLQGALHIEELDRRNLEASLLFELGGEVAEALDLPRVQRAVETTARLLRCACRYILIPEENDAIIRVSACPSVCSRFWSGVAGSSTSATSALPPSRARSPGSAEVGR